TPRAQRLRLTRIIQIRRRLAFQAPPDTTAQIRWQLGNRFHMRDHHHPFGYGLCGSKTDPDEPGVAFVSNGAACCEAAQWYSFRRGADEASDLKLPGSPGKILRLQRAAGVSPAGELWTTDCGLAAASATKQRRFSRNFNNS